MPDLSGTAPSAAEPDARYTVAGFGYDDVSLGFDLSTSALSLTRVRAMDGREIGASKRLGWEASWGKFENLLGRSYLDAERLGVAREIYSERLYSARHKEARELGLSVNDVGEDPVDLDLHELLKTARDIRAA